MIRIALAQFDFPVGAVGANATRIAGMIAHARDELGADLVLFPEQALSGYPAEDLLLRPSFLRACDEALAAIAGEVRGIVAVVGHPEPRGSVVYNAASVLRDGRIEHTYRKRELPNYAVFDERRYFATGDRACVFDVGGVDVGLVICEDLWFAHPLRETAVAGAQLVLVPNASPFEAGKLAERDALLSRRIAESGVAVAYLNVVGGQDELVFDGASVLADGDGTLHDAAPAFADHWLVADFEPTRRVFAPVSWPREQDESDASLTWRALVRATGDYVRKNGFSRAWVGLSGGIDSALTLAIAVDALGAEAVTAVRLPSRYTVDLSNDLAAEQAAALGVELLTLPIEPPFLGFLESLATPEGTASPVARVTRSYSGSGTTWSPPTPVGARHTRDQTPEGIAGPDDDSSQNVASSHDDAASSGDVASPVAHEMRSHRGGAGAPEGDGPRDAPRSTPAGDLTEENLQSRCRGTLLMALSNRYGGLVLTTGNKSEYAVGYATIYGDMAGAFAPLKDVYKTGVYALARWRNGIGPAIPEAVIARAPTAELRENQTDQDSLPPYDLLDAILHRFVDLEHSVEEIVADGYDAATVARVARLVLLNEYKRRQSAPGPKVSRRAFGRERRYPITSGWR